MRGVTRGCGLGGMLGLLVLGLPVRAGADYYAGWYLDNPCANKVEDALYPPVTGSGSFPPFENLITATCQGIAFSADVTFAHDAANRLIAGTAGTTLDTSATLDLMGAWQITLSGGAVGTKLDNLTLSTHYDLGISGIAGQFASLMRASALMGIGLRDANLNRVEAAYVNFSLIPDQNGSAAGILSSGQYSLICCTALMQAFGTLDVVNGASAHFTDDPPSISGLPAGWTYTATPVPIPLSVYEQTFPSVPEPSTALLLAAGVVGLVVLRQRGEPRQHREF